jgi:hypothetical protein
MRSCKQRRAKNNLTTCRDILCAILIFSIDFQLPCCHDEAFGGAMASFENSAQKILWLFDFFGLSDDGPTKRYWVASSRSLAKRKYIKELADKKSSMRTAVPAWAYAFSLMTKAGEAQEHDFIKCLEDKIGSLKKDRKNDVIYWFDATEKTPEEYLKELSSSELEQINTAHSDNYPAALKAERAPKVLKSYFPWFNILEDRFSLAYFKFLFANGPEPSFAELRGQGDDAGSIHSIEHTPTQGLTGLWNVRPIRPSDIRVASNSHVDYILMRANPLDEAQLGITSPEATWSETRSIQLAIVSVRAANGQLLWEEDAYPDSWNRNAGFQSSSQGFFANVERHNGRVFVYGQDSTQLGTGRFLAYMDLPNNDAGARGFMHSDNAGGKGFSEGYRFWMCPADKLSKGELGRGVSLESIRAEINNLLAAMRSPLMEDDDRVELYNKSTKLFIRPADCSGIAVRGLLHIFKPRIDKGDGKGLVPAKRSDLWDMQGKPLAGALEKIKMAHVESGYLNSGFDD